VRYIEDVTADVDTLPADPEALRALLIAERAQHAAERDRLRAIIVALQRHRFGRRSEQLAPDQLALGLEDLEQSVAAAEAQEERVAAPGQSRPARQRKINRGALPEHLPRVDVVIDVEDRRCPCCAGALHPIGEDVAERLDVTPLQFACWWSTGLNTLAAPARAPSFRRRPRRDWSRAACRPKPWLPM
jgi:transposase